jgi:hypothetical protein
VSAVAAAGTPMAAVAGRLASQAPARQSRVCFHDVLLQRDDPAPLPSPGWGEGRRPESSPCRCCGRQPAGFGEHFLSELGKGAQIFVGEVEFPRPSGKRHGAITNRDEVIVSSVVGLLDPGRPPAISGRVIAVIVDPIKLVFWRRLRPHVSQEALERAPSFTDSDPTSAVVFVARVAFIAAPLVYTSPCLIFAGPALNSGLAVRDGAFQQCLQMQATASTGVACHEMCADRDRLIAAITRAQPTRLPVAAVFDTA